MMTFREKIEIWILSLFISLTVGWFISLYNQNSQKDTENSPQCINSHNVQFLFETNGVSVYSFRDSGRGLRHVVIGTNGDVAIR